MATFTGVRVGMIVLLVSCGGGQAPEPSHATRSSTRVDATGIDPKACPLVPLAATATPAIDELATLDDVRRAISRGGASSTFRYASQPDPHLEWPAQVILRVDLRYLLASTTSRFDNYVVFSRDQGHVLAGSFFRTTEQVPASCGTEVTSAIVDARTFDGADGRQYGRVRVRRRGVDDRPTLPSIVAASADGKPGCEALVSFRIEDHIIDLGDAKEVGAVAQTYRAPLYEPVDAPAIGIDKLSITKQGITVDDPRCGAPFALRP